MLRYTVSGMIRGKLAELASAAESTESCLSAAVWIGAQTFIWTNWNGSTRARRTRKFEAELWLIYPNKVSWRRSATDSSPLKADGSWQLHPRLATFMVRHHYVMLFLIGKNFFLSSVKKKQRGGGAGSGARSWWPHVGFAVTTVKSESDRWDRPLWRALFVFFEQSEGFCVKPMNLVMDDHGAVPHPRSSGLRYVQLSLGALAVSAVYFICQWWRKPEDHVWPLAF